jgi:hypothetical protein
LAVVESAGETMRYLTAARLLLLVGPFALLTAPGATSSESLIELPTGGIGFSKMSDPAAFALESENIVITPTNVAISYAVANKGAAPLEMQLEFHFPDLDFSDPDAQYAIPGSDPLNFLGASLQIDGRPASFAFTQKALLDGKDVTAVLRQSKIALAPVGAFQNELASTPQALREKLANQRLIVESGASVDGKPLFFPVWTVTTNATRKAVVPPMGVARIDLNYLTSLGASPDTVLRKALREQKGLEAEVKAKRATYCVDDGFLGGLDKLAGADEANASGVSEMRIWLKINPAAAPAAHFKLVVDKAKDRRIVSFCQNNLKKASTTSFEMKSDNYTPAPELRVLLIERRANRPVDAGAAGAPPK